MTVLTRIMGSRSQELSGFQTTRMLPSPEPVAAVGSSSPPPAAGVGLYTSTRWMMNFDDPALKRCHCRGACRLQEALVPMPPSSGSSSSTPLSSCFKVLL